MKPVTVSLNFMPAFYHKHAGVTYGEPYYFEPRYRAEVECAENRLLYEMLGRFGVGSPRPIFSASLFIQPIDLLKLTQGAELHCPPDATLETRGHPWADLTPGQVARIDPHAAAHHPIVDMIVRQYRDMRTLYGQRADVFGIKTGLMNIHSPYTTAHQLCGESLFLLLMDNPDATRTLSAKIWDIYRAIFERLGRELDAPAPDRLQLGDCSAALLSPAAYRAAVLPVNRALAAEFPASGYHSCGASSHLLSAFADIPRVTAIELGAGTDLAAAVRMLPGAELRPLIDPVLMLNATPERVGQAVASIVDATAAAPATTLCAWSFDGETPVQNVEALYRTVQAAKGNEP